MLNMFLVPLHSDIRILPLIYPKFATSQRCFEELYKTRKFKKDIYGGLTIPFDLHIHCTHIMFSFRVITNKYD